MTTSSSARFATVAELFDDWRDDLLSGNPPVLYRCGDGELARINIGPGLVTLFGGAPATGKTAFVTFLRMLILTTYSKNTERHGKSTCVF